MTDVTSQKHVALCPKCEAPHAYTQVRFRGGINDYGYWCVRCQRCGTAFLISVVNPAESHAQFEVDNRFEGDDRPPELLVATDRSIHDGPESDFAPSFDYSGPALYRCSKIGSSLEYAAFQALRANFESVTAAYRRAENYLCDKSAFKCENAVVHVNVPCSCALTGC